MIFNSSDIKLVGVQFSKKHDLTIHATVVHMCINSNIILLSNTFGDNTHKYHFS